MGQEEERQRRPTSSGASFGRMGYGPVGQAQRSSVGMDADTWLLILPMERARTQRALRQDSAMRSRQLVEMSIKRAQEAPRQGDRRGACHGLQQARQALRGDSGGSQAGTSASRGISSTTSSGNAATGLSGQSSSGSSSPSGGPSSSGSQAGGAADSGSGSGASGTSQSGSTSARCAAPATASSPC
jgi:hypothetical protein